MSDASRDFADNLYDVFVNIRDDEAEHCKTMVACQTRGNIQSPHAVVPVKNIDGESPPAECSGILECLLTSSLLAQKVGKDISANKHR
jgi:ubiquinol oxidase